MKSLVSIILLNYNNNKFTLDCIRSLYKQKFRNFEIIVVDNGSKYENYSNLKTNLDNFKSTLNIKLIRSKYNLYFTAGNNKGIKNAKGEYICLLNNDTVVNSDFLEKIINYLDKNKDVGMLCPKIMYYKKKNYIWYAGAYLNPRSIYFSYHFGMNQKDTGKFNNITETAYANGAALFTRREVIEKIGLLDEIFLIYVDETDWNYKAKELGYKIVYFPDTKVYHKVELTTKENMYGFRENPFQIYLYTRNKIIFTLKHFSIINILFFLLIFQFKSTITEIMLSIIQRKPDFLRAHFRALFMGFLIGVRRRTNRKCRKLLKYEIIYINKFPKYRKS